MKIDFDFEKSMQTTFNLLDEIDIMSILNKKRGRREIEVHELMEILKEHVGEKVDDYPELEGCLFDAVNDYEFIEYLENRYKKQIYSRELITNYIGVSK
jgi:hypothetical protein